MYNLGGDTDKKKEFHEDMKVFLKKDKGKVLRTENQCIAYIWK